MCTFGLIDLKTPRNIASIIIKNMPRITNSAVPARDTRLSAKLTTPGTLNVGLRQEIGEDIAVLLGFEWADWSQLKQLKLVSKTAVPVPGPTDFSWNDSYFYSIGAEGGI